MGIRELRGKYSDSFEEFWSCYPRHTDRQEALNVFIELGEEGVDLQYVIAKAKSYSRNVDPDQLRYCPSPKTWLRGRRWEDEDLFTDQIVSVREWFVRAWREGDVGAVQKKYGFIYPDPPIPAAVTDVSAFRRDDRVRWVGQIANHVLNAKPLPD